MTIDKKGYNGLYDCLNELDVRMECIQSLFDWIAPEFEDLTKENRDIGSFLYLFRDTIERIRKIVDEGFEHIWSVKNEGNRSEKLA